LKKYRFIDFVRIGIFGKFDGSGGRDGARCRLYTKRNKAYKNAILNQNLI